MKAIRYSKFGAARDVLALVECDAPAPRHGEVLVRMKTSAINPSDTKKRAGANPGELANGPVIPNSDGAGVIEAVGPGVSQARVGQRVWVYQAQFERPWGTAAEYLAIDARRAATLPDNVGFDVGACLGIPAMTAHRCVSAGGPVAGQLVLVTGGAGRVGHYAIQWAKLAGATVVATASNAASETECRAAGADLVVDHRDADWDAQLLDWTGGRRIDRVVDCEFGANLAKVLEVIRIGGEIATYSSTLDPEPRVPFRRMMFMDLTIRMVIVYAMPEVAKQAAIEDIDHALRSGLLIHRVARRLPLKDFAEASALIEGGKVRGCVVVELP